MISILITIGEYSIGGILVVINVIILMAIGAYFINGYR
jgi:hypothetical protein